MVILPPPVHIAIIGAGPAGLGAAIALSQLNNNSSSFPHLHIKIYEKAHLLREIGAGIRIGYNCWRVLELLGASQDVRGHRKEKVLHRNGFTGEVLLRTDNTVHGGREVERKVEEGIIELGKQVVALERVPVDQGGGARLTFADGTSTHASLVIGGDGIRSIVRQSLFPSHNTRFTGTTIFRTLIPISSVQHIPDVAEGTSWWHGPDGHVYLSPVDDPEEIGYRNADGWQERMFEISCRRTFAVEEEAEEKKFSWGVPVSKQRVGSHFTDYDARPRAAQSAVPEGAWKEFAAFAGPRLDTLIGWDCVALLGDASHPLTGAFGSGAAFALEDAWILARAIEYTPLHHSQQSQQQQLGQALRIFDEIRSPYYAEMYRFLDLRKRQVQAAKQANPNQTLDEEILTKLGGLGLSEDDSMDWIYFNDIEKVWEAWVAKQDKERQEQQQPGESVCGDGIESIGEVVGLVLGTGTVVEAVAA
ncbi:2-heptyl-3-hydroxy-4(1H)-quinolone synthase [Cyphellophora attinorum]|uniref:2-heptyl-3-hydroxy-4(1H)-quinolone synthase n=1 Tax=Cyphellophora attinorum TaxID=1664694 RepID=A0A0N1HAM1_9EURO|nr:2-heptyl-3-hydroxy-4(1H)-quinolone synthase [Phialophora attinorum]KPI45097.1 2-heptyl-3-hydroxy-4(1H)-quinolone synthase [Phialophora attinorum]